MTEAEQFEFCGTITKAASRLGIYGRFQENYFVWFDPQVGARWKTEPAADKKSILVKACQSLQQYLTKWNRHQNT